MCEWLPVSQGATNCPDCNSENPQYYNPNYEIFICRNCAQAHEEVRCKRAKLKCVKIESLTQEKLTAALNGEGNVKVNGRQERFLPLYYPKQGDRTPQDIRKEFITHKYVHETFCTHAAFLKYIPATGRMEGVLEKKGKDKSIWKPRHFVLTPLSIEYFLETGHSEPKSRLSLSQLELHLEACEGTRSCLVLTHLSDSGVSGRKYYVRTAGGDLLFDWYFALLTAQAAKFEFTPVTQGEETKLGNLYKVGGHRLDLWKMRWFCLQGSHVTYSTDKLSATIQGDFKLGPADLVETGTTHIITAPTKFTFQIITLDRTYKLCAETAHERNDWMDAFSKAIALQAHAV